MLIQEAVMDNLGLFPDRIESIYHGQLSAEFFLFAVQALAQAGRLYTLPVPLQALLDEAAVSTTQLIENEFERNSLDYDSTRLAVEASDKDTPRIDAIADCSIAMHAIANLYAEHFEPFDLTTVMLQRANTAKEACHESPTIA